MDVTAGSHNGYNWDDLSIGYGELDQSRQFFARKHIKHEKFYTDCVNFKNAYEKENKKNLPNIQREREDHPNIRRSPVKAITPDNKPILEDKNKDASGKADQKGNYNKVLHKDSDKKITSVGTSSSTQANIAVNQKSSRDKIKRRSKSVPPVRFSSFKKEQRVLFSLNENESSSQKARRPRNLLINSKEFEDLPNIKFGKTGPQTVVPSAFLYSEKYQKNRNEKIKKSLEEDKKKRVFHSKPAPNFRAIHEANFQKKQVSEKKLYITAPATPLVLKKSQEYGEKKKKVIEEYEKRLKEQKFVSRPANVIYDEPFQPKKEPLVLETKPFNLHVEKRLEERKKYDEEINKLMETKKKEEELRRKKEEEECIKKIRKQAVFKAQKNPFK